MIFLKYLALNEFIYIISSNIIGIALNVGFQLCFNKHKYKYKRVTDWFCVTYNRFVYVYKYTYLLWKSKLAFLKSRLQMYSACDFLFNSFFRFVFLMLYF